MRFFLSLLFALGCGVVLHFSTFTLPEFEQAIIVQFGSIRGEPITKAGVHFKLPFLQEVMRFDKRILQWDGDRGEIPTKDKKFIWVDTTARWRISNASDFYRSVHTIPNALNRMGTVIVGITKDTISSFNLIETVRNSNKILEQPSVPDEFIDLTSDLEKIEYGREKIAEMITERARAELQSFGIEIMDVELRSIGYKEVVEQKVYERMISEQQKIATKIRSSGKGEEAKILGQMDLRLKSIQSEAYREAQTTRGVADAEASKLFANAFKDDPAFFSFVKTLESYKESLKDRDWILSTDHPYLDSSR
jgi:membrane protease subunit HflC